MSRNSKERLPLFQVFINELPKVDAYRRWYFANYGDQDRNRRFKAQAAAAFANAAFLGVIDEVDVKQGIKAWHERFGDSVPPADIKAFVKFITPTLSDAGVRALHSLKEKLAGESANAAGRGA